MTEDIHAFIDAQDVREITAPFFKEGEVVTIKKFSYADRQALSGEYMKLSADWGSGRGGKRGGKAKRAKRDATVKSEIVLGKMNLSILDRGIESWTLYDRKGKEVSFSRANIRKLSEPYAEFILEAINDFNPSRDESEDGEEDGDDGNFFLEADSSGEGDG